KGSPGSCTNAVSRVIDASNSSDWVQFTNEEGEAVAEINANGNVLGNVSVSYFVNDGPVRKDEQGVYYLDRNISINPANAPISPISVRLYIRAAEFNALKGTPGSGVVAFSDLAIFRNTETCKYDIEKGATPIPSTHELWEGDMVFTTSVMSASSFYIASKTAAALPVNIITFKGSAVNDVNRLTWKADCTEDVNFTIERSTDGINYFSVGLIMATQADCGSTFKFDDKLPPAKALYRLKMQEVSGPLSYSGIVSLNRNGKNEFIVRVMPNPVIGGRAHLQIESTTNKTITYNIYDGMGRSMNGGKLLIQPGNSNYPLNVSGLPAGIYSLVYNDGANNATIRFVKQ
ncbi:MAG: T9SS type A sorting domain-containing protein, partial [Chitinophagaceae bacterium]|nr:T9SS type A sorting domain-containing protein [Chitinophagaceae bacterium]